jgi:predicted ATPase/DNA-binding winged helix-turn-helix (wHTH) protein
MDIDIHDKTASFGPFVLHPARQVLLDEGKPVRLGGRAMALLCLLVDRAGTTQTRDELVAHVWPDTIVEETSLRVHVAALRKALGDGQGGRRYIANVVGRGYGFVAPVAWSHAEAAAPAIAPSTPAHNLPARLTRAVGRASVTASLGQQLGRCRLVCIVGPGGIGKTTVALAVAEASMSDFRDGACFVDLARLSDPLALGPAVAAALGVVAPGDNPLPALRAHLRERRTLLVLDNCEHVIEAVAVLAEELLKAAPKLHILATSREPLNAEGESVHRLVALTTPRLDDKLDIEQALRFSAVQLFVERAMANTDGFVLSESNLPFVQQVCCRLDGMPLAIELAAGRVDSLGVQGLATRMDDAMRLLTRGRRTGEPRHRALQAVLDWSHDLLDESERTILRRLAIFRSAFTLDSASRIAACERIDSSAVVDALLSLVDKSLVTVDASGEHPHYRLLFATRSYAAMRLEASGERPALARRHAEYFRDLLLSANTATVRPAWLDSYAVIFDDVNAAVEWALTEPGAAEIGITLVNWSSRLGYLQIGFMETHLAQVERALALFTRSEPAQPFPELDLLGAWLSLSGVSNAVGRSRQEIVARIQELVPLVDDEDRASVLTAMSVAAFGQGDYPASIRLADELEAIPEQPREAVARTARRLLALNHHFMGEHGRARTLALPLIDELPAPDLRNWQNVGRRPFTLRLILARILWLEGHVDQALRMAQRAVAESEGAHPFARCKALGHAAVPVALWRGDLDAAAGFVEQLRDNVNRCMIGYWKPWVEGYDRIIAARRAGQSVVMSAENHPEDPLRNPTHDDALGTFAEELLSARALARVEQGVVGWCAPEALRARGENLLRGGQGADEAEALFQRALQMARSQDALSWELRAACSLARRWASTGRRADAKHLLSATYERFGEGHATADLVGAHRLLLELS